MDVLSRLLRELIDCAVPQGNKRGELHVLVDELAAEGAAAEVPAEAKAADAKAAVPPPAASFVPPLKLTAPSDGAAGA